MKNQLFISHAFEDKELALELTQKLKARGMDVWLASEQIKVGDSIANAVSQGLVQSEWGVVLISPTYLQKSWATAELNALFSLEHGSNTKILPIWHGITEAELKQRQPLLADKFAVSTANGWEPVVDALQRAVESSDKKAFRLSSLPLRNTATRAIQPKSKNLWFWLGGLILMLGLIFGIRSCEEVEPLQVNPKTSIDNQPLDEENHPTGTEKIETLSIYQGIRKFSNNHKGYRIYASPSGGLGENFLFEILKVELSKESVSTLKIHVREEGGRGLITCSPLLGRECVCDYVGPSSKGTLVLDFQSDGSASGGAYNIGTISHGWITIEPR